MPLHQPQRRIQPHARRPRRHQIRPPAISSQHQQNHRDPRPGPSRHQHQIALGQNLMRRQPIHGRHTWHRCHRRMDRRCWSSLLRLVHIARHLQGRNHRHPLILATRAPNLPSHLHLAVRHIIHRGAGGADDMQGQRLRLNHQTLYNRRAVLHRFLSQREKRPGMTIPNLATISPDRFGRPRIASPTLSRPGHAITPRTGGDAERHDQV